MGTAAHISASASPPGVRIRRGQRRGILPGFGLSLGYTLSYLSLIVLIPLTATFARLWNISPSALLSVVCEARVVSAFKVSLLTSLSAALVNVIFGLLVAWVLVRYRFPGKRLVDAMVDLPFALPTAVAGIALTTIYDQNGWLGKPLSLVGIQSAYSTLGITIALIFIGLPFIVRTVQPVLEDLDAQYEEAAWSLGATAGQTFWRVTLPEVLPALLTGFALAFARGFGEYGSVVFIAGNQPLHTEIVPLIINSKYEQHDIQGATVVAALMLVASFLMLLLINLLQRWASAHQEV